MLNIEDLVFRIAMFLVYPFSSVISFAQQIDTSFADKYNLFLVYWWKWKHFQFYKIELIQSWMWNRSVLFFPPLIGNIHTCGFYFLSTDFLPFMFQRSNWTVKDYWWASWLFTSVENYLEMIIISNDHLSAIRLICNILSV